MISLVKHRNESTDGEWRENNSFSRRGPGKCRCLVFYADLGVTDSKIWMRKSVFAGACTVHVNGQRLEDWVTTMEKGRGWKGSDKREGLEKKTGLTPLQKAGANQPCRNAVLPGRNNSCRQRRY